MGGLKLFLSHSSRDEEITISFYLLFRYGCQLRSGEVRCTTVPSSSVVIAHNNNLLLDEISKAELIVYILSPSWRDSPFFQQELEIGMSLDHKNILVFKCCGQGYDDVPQILKEVSLIDTDDIDKIRFAMCEAAKLLGTQERSDDFYMALSQLISTISKGHRAEYWQRKGAADRIDG
jgi:hypothetical protein